ncbi:MAG: serine/threonine-protein kinase [Planctomycetota bacterium]
MEGGLNLQPGQVVQGQTLVEKLGEGGFGEVWRAEYYGQAVAVKFFHRSDRLEGSRRESIAQYVLGRLKHEDGGRFFPRVEHFDLDATPPYMRMELIEGKSLNHHFTKQAQFELGKALRVAENLLAGMVVIHDLGFVHGDLSASNVLVQPDEKVKLIDVGYGVLFQESQDLARSTAMTMGVSVGAATPLYSAPERFTPEFLSPDVGKRTDIYSFGKLLYQMLTWESPGTVKPVSRKVTSLGAAWDDFIFQCVSDRPQERFADARAALAAYQELPIGVALVPTADRTDTKVRRSMGKFRSLVEIALADRILTGEEREYLHQKGEQMGIPFQEAEQVIQELAKAAPPPPTRLVPVASLAPSERVQPGWSASPPPLVVPRVEGMTVACRRCTQPNIVPHGTNPAFYACSACGANLGVSQSGCPQCGRELIPRRGAVGAVSTVLILIILAIGMVAATDNEIGPCAAVGGIGFAVMVALVAPRKQAWQCVFCRKTYADLATMRPQGSSGVSCLAWLIILAAALGVLSYAGMPRGMW